MRGDLTIVNASAVVTVHDRGAPRRGAAQSELDVVERGAVAIRGGEIVAVGPEREVLDRHGRGGAVLDAAGGTVLPGLVECHSHPLFGGDRHAEYAERLAGASLAEVAARGGGIWSSVVATREADDATLAARLDRALRRMVLGGITCVEVKSGYGLTVADELRQLALLAAARARTPLELVITFLGAHVLPRDLEPRPGSDVGDTYTDLVAGAMTDAVVAQGIAQFQDVTVEDGLFSPQQAARLIARSRELGLPVRVHADAWKPSHGWATAVAGGAVSAEHLTYTTDAEIDRVGETETIAVVLPVAELVYMTDRRANARRLIDTGVALAVSTDHCSSIHATSLLSTVTMAAPWYRITPDEAIVACTLNAAYSLGVAGRRGSLDVGKRGDAIVVAAPHPDELFLGLGDDLLGEVVIGGEVVYSTPR